MSTHNLNEQYIKEKFESTFSIMSQKARSWIHNEYHTKAFFPELLNLFSKYDIPFHYAHTDDSLIYTTYLMVDSKEGNDFMIEKSILETEKEMENLPFGKIRSAKKDDVETFPELIGRDIAYTYFCFPSVDTAFVKAILLDKMGREDSIAYLPDDDTISYFLVEEDILLRKHNVNPQSHIIMCNLKDCNIPIILVYDRSGVFQYRTEINEESSTRFFYRIDLKMAFRSSWEANFARVLKYLDIPFEYEKTSFQRYSVGKNEPMGYYFPDFFLPDNTIVEVKGFWDADSRNKVHEFVKRYVDYKLYIVDSDVYYSIKSKYQRLICDWETDESGINSQQIQVVGINYGQRKYVVKTLSIGQKVSLVRDTQNSYDSNAIGVFTEEKQDIGFVSADWACIYAPKIDIGMTFEATIQSIEPNVISVNVIRHNCEEAIMYEFLCHSSSLQRFMT